MTVDWTAYACLMLGLSAALVAGVFQTFSDFVMGGLMRAKPASGIDAMQQLNRTVFRSVFLATFLALVPATISFAFYAWFTLDGLAARLILAAALVYIPLVFLVTIFGNVPMNERLDKMDSESEAAAAYWLIYGRAWTSWNTLRMIGSIVTAGCYLLAAVHID